MLPRILVGQNNVDFDTYVADFISQNPAYSTATYTILPNEKNSITIDQIRALKQELKVKSISRLILIYSFNCATLEAQNALLKTLEEKSEQNIFMLQVHHSGDVLPTIVSRCMIIPLTKDEKSALASPEVRQLIDSLVKNSGYSYLSESLMQPSNAKETEELFLAILHALHQNILKGDMKSAESAKIALELLTLLQHNNLNHQLALDTWYLRSKKIFCQT